MTGLRLSATLYLPREMVPKAKTKESKMTNAVFTASERSLLSQFVLYGRSIVSVSRESVEWLFGEAIFSLEERSLVSTDEEGYLNLTAEGADCALALA